MVIWTNFVEFLVMILVTLSQAYGGNLGLAIITLSLVVRLALLPITLQSARRAQGRQTRLQALQPEIEQLRRRYRSNPQRLSQETAKVYSRHGVGLFDRAGILGGMVQLPVFAGLYSAISQGIAAGGRFLWIGNLAQPDWFITIAIGVLTFAASALNPDLPRSMRYLYTVLPALLTVFVVWQFAAGLGLYWATSSSVSLLQTILLGRRTSQRS